MLSWSEHTVRSATCSGLLAVDRVTGGCESNPQPLDYESDTLPLDHCTHPVPFASYLTLNNTVTLKFGLEVTRCH